MRHTTVEKKKAKGTYRPGRMQTVKGLEFEIVSDLSPPEEIELNKRALDEWNVVAPPLHEKKILTVADRKLLAAYCLEIAKYFGCLNDIETLGNIIPLKNGKGQIVNYMKNPNFDLADKALQNAIKLGAHFGLTPASRGKLALPKTPVDSPEERAKDQLNALRQKVGKVVKMVS